VRRPTGAEVSNFYPPVAQMLGLDGHVVMECGVSAQGGMEDCTIRSESPVGMDFGKAAVLMADLFQMKPKTIDGAPVGGAKVLIPIGFLYPHQYDGGPPPPAEAGPAPSAKALALARGIVELSNPPATYVERARSQIGARLAALSLTEQEQAAVDSYMSALQSALPAAEDAQAERIARALPEDELGQIAAFMATPAGRDWMAAASNVTQNSQQDYVRLFAAVRNGAKALFCQTHSCPPPQPEGPPAATP
jgi:TonB family protein